ncbi:multidrug MFS transporter [Paenibacillus pectinilyticus]|uniref:Multidrug MFS transporter n=1 Tax=Paenibacillus pectinilyticus TaxID=512399 RepID=A0A1C0ZRL0_9BACL|nr:sugar transferase [Paenibacillus pectinilyticus]OCT10698.1 multidrug MFS transporter [Paenibacillus pectinilyticus]
MPNISTETPVLEAEKYYASRKVKAVYQEKTSYVVVKRVVDFLGALVGIVLCLPVFLILAVLIKLEDRKGAVFFYQLRVGKDEKQFKMFKFRSMVSNAEELLADLLEKNEIEGHMFKLKEDPRITRMGKFIRKTSMDELPQLWNVLKGEMSLVGPRPPLVREVEQYSDYHKQRLHVVPGCTGLWQISGRNNVSFEKMVELDLQYIKSRSIMTDLKIILKTSKVLLGSKDAY